MRPLIAAASAARSRSLTRPRPRPRPLAPTTRVAAVAARGAASSPSPSENGVPRDERATTHFGFRDVDVAEKEGLVREVFASVADSYDVMNDLMSGGLHRYWKDELLAMTSLASTAKVVRRRAADEVVTGTTPSPSCSSASSSPPSPLLSVLDVAGGTGDVAFRLVEAAGCVERAKSSGRDEISVTVCDINPDMLRVGEARARERFGGSILDDDTPGAGGVGVSGSGALRFVEGNAEDLPFEDGSFDLYTIAFGLRNVTDVDAALREAFRVLKPGGRYMCLEFSRVDNVALRSLYDAYSFNVIPTIGEVVAGDRSSYQYLVESIRKFSNQEELATRLESAGFDAVKYTNLTGGIVAVHEGWKAII